MSAAAPPSPVSAYPDRPPGPARNASPIRGTGYFLPCVRSAGPSRPPIAARPATSTRKGKPPSTAGLPRQAGQLGRDCSVMPPGHAVPGASRVCVARLAARDSDPRKAGMEAADPGGGPPIRPPWRVPVTTAWTNTTAIKPAPKIPMEPAALSFHRAAPSGVTQSPPSSLSAGSCPSWPRTQLSHRSISPRTRSRSQYRSACRTCRSA